MTIDDIIDGVLRAEGGYVNDVRDAGGETNFGITIQTARQNGYTGAMRDMPKDFAREVYYRRYVVGPGFDKIVAISPAIAAELVDTGVNMGPKVAATFLQRTLNVFNNQGRDYPDIAVDGDAGGKTRAALDAFLAKRGVTGERVMMNALNALQGERYISLGEGRATNEAFEFGWFANRVIIT